MSKTPVLSSRECVKRLEKAGFVFSRQRGSHIILHRSDPPTRLSVPDHNPISRGTLRAIIRQAGLTVGEFNELGK